QHVELCAETVFSQFKTSDIIITIDLWDFSKLQGTCEICKQSRLRRLQAMNLAQTLLPTPSTSCTCHS
ncbi:MAG: hypothetical protein ABGW78_03985, partial [Pirellulales bacterium]